MNIISIKSIVLRIWAILKKNYILFLASSLSLTGFLINAGYVSYPDEFVNLLAGKFLLQGKLPYSGFFDHHMPFAWYLSSFILTLSRESYVIFRTVWAITMFLSLLGLGIYIQKRQKNLIPYYALFFAIYPFLAVYYWLHLYLADGIASLLIAIVMWIVLVETYQKKLSDKSLFIGTFLVFLAIMTSLTYIYVSVFLYLWLFFIYIKRKTKKRFLKFIAVAASPYIVFLLWLFITNTLKDFYISNFVYNVENYITVEHYTKGNYFNPLKFGFALIFNFQEKFLPLLTTVKDFNLYGSPATGFAAAWGIFALFILLLKEKPLYAVIYLVLISFSAPRSDIASINETNYQVGVYLVVGWTSLLFFLWRADLLKLKKKSEIIVHFFITAVAVLYIIFPSFFLLKNTYEKWFWRYTQVMPGIYDRGDVSGFINDTISAQDVFWIGPYEPNEMFFVKKGHVPGKYISLLPQFRENNYFKNDFLNTFKENPPDILIYKKTASIFMTPSIEFGAFFLKWIDKNYYSLSQKNAVIKKSPTGINMKEDVFIRKDRFSIFSQRLEEKGYVKF